MDLSKMIAELRAERSAIDETLAVLERLASARGTRGRGRPPTWMKVQLEAAQAPKTKPKKTRAMSEEVRAKMAEGQRKRWEAYRKAKAQS